MFGSVGKIPQIILPYKNTVNILRESKFLFFLKNPLTDMNPKRAYTIPEAPIWFAGLPKLQSQRPVPINSHMKI